LKYNHFKIILKLAEYFISHVTTSETEIESFQPLKELRNYFKIISATLNMPENIRELCRYSENSFEILWGKFSRAEIK